MARRRARHQPHDQDLRSGKVGRAGLLALFALVPLVYHGELFAFAVIPKRLLLQAVLVVIAAVWAAELGRQPERWYGSRMSLPVLLYALAMLVAFGQASNRVAALEHLAHALTFVLFFFLVLRILDLKDIPALLRVTAVVGIVVSVLGILEARGFDMNWLPSNGRPSATFAYRNFAASYLIMALPLAAGLWLTKRNTTDFVLSSLALGLMSVFLIYTRTRGAWAGLLGASVVALILAVLARMRSGKRSGLDWRYPGLRVQLCVLIPLGVAVLLLSVLSPDIRSNQSRLIDERKAELLSALTSVTVPGADRGRRAMWGHTVEMIRDHPLTGVGPGNWQFIYPLYDGGDMLKPGAAPQRPHNDFLWIASELGLPGILAFLWILAAAALTAWRGIRHAVRPGHAVHAIVFGTAALAMVGHGMFSFPRERIETSFLFWFSLAALTVLNRSARPSPQSSGLASLNRVAWYLAPLALLLAAGLTYRQANFGKHYLLARSAYLSKDYRTTLIESERALSYGPFDPQAFLMRGKGLQAAGRVPEALRNNRHALEAYHPNSPELLGDLGTYYAMLDSLDQAEACFRRVLELSPDLAGMNNNLGGIYYKRGDYAKAIDQFKMAMGQGHQYIDARNNLGLAYVATGRMDEAIGCYIEALDQVPGDPALLHNLADARYEKALAEGTSMLPALQAYERFLRNWHGPASQAAEARKRIRAIRHALASGGDG